MTDGADTERLIRYVEQALELRERGTVLSVEALCRDHPGLAHAVREALERTSEFEDWVEDHTADDPLANRVLAGRYRIESRIGAGAMGAVYRASDLELKRFVAIKLLQPHLFGGPEAETRFLREAEALAALRHPNVVAVHDRGVTTDGLHYLVMELVRGFPLSRVLSALSQRQADHGRSAVRGIAWVEALDPAVRLAERNYVRLCARWAAELAGGLAAAHAAGIYHRDVKPSNVLIARDGRALLVDFGVAAREEDATLTRGDSTLGTPIYMPPEQAAGRCAPSPQLDIYSLAATVYHLLAARGPYEGDARQVIAALQREEPLPLGRLRRDLPGDLLAVVECGMAREPGRRYASASALESDLRAFLAHEPVNARRTGPVERAWRRARRSRTVQVVALASMVAVSALGLLAWSQAREQARLEQYAGVVAELPGTLSFGRHPTLDVPEDRARIAAKLDRAVDFGPEQLVARVARAGFRLDHEDPAGAAEDMRALAANVDTAYVVALAERYAGAEGAGHGALDLQGLPEPASPEDRYVAGYHALRDVVTRRDGLACYRRAGKLLRADPEHLPSRDLALIPRLVLAVQNLDAQALQSLYADAQELEGVYGRPTARTSYVSGSTLLAVDRYEAATPPLERAATLAPRTYQILVNLGIAYRLSGALEAAQQALGLALEVRPGASKALSALAKVKAQQRDYEQALALAQRIPDNDRRADAVGSVEFERAYWLDATGQTEAAREAAQRAIASLRSLLDQGYHSPTLEIDLARMQAIIDGDYNRLVAVTLELLAGDARDPIYLRRLLAILPSRLDRKQTESLRVYLRALHDQENRRRESLRSSVLGLEHHVPDHR
ncbi:MAG: protein kinase [Planctomycetota bacterium]